MSFWSNLFKFTLKEKHVFLITKIVTYELGHHDEYAYGHQVWDVRFKDNGMLEEADLKMIRKEMNAVAKDWMDWKVEYKYQDRWYFITKRNQGKTLSFK